MFLKNSSLKWIMNRKFTGCNRLPFRVSLHPYSSHSQSSKKPLRVRTSWWIPSFLRSLPWRSHASDGSAMGRPSAAGMPRRCRGQAWSQSSAASPPRPRTSPSWFPLGWGAVGTLRRPSDNSQVWSQQRCDQVRVELQQQVPRQQLLQGGQPQECPATAQQRTPFKEINRWVRHEVDHYRGKLIQQARDERERRDHLQLHQEELGRDREIGSQNPPKPHEAISASPSAESAREPEVSVGLPTGTGMKTSRDPWCRGFYWVSQGSKPGAMDYPWNFHQIWWSS